MNSLFFEKFENITNSDKYKLILVNNFGIFIKFLNNEDNLSYILKQNFGENMKYIGLYKFKQLFNHKFGTNIISINFISHYLLNEIFSINNIYDNNLENINMPCFIVDETFENYEDLIERIKQIYEIYFGNDTINIFDLKIYLIKNYDIIDLNLFQIKFIEVSEDNFNYEIKERDIITRLVVGY